MAKTLSNINKSHKNIVDEMGFAVIGDAIEDIEVGDIENNIANKINSLSDDVEELKSEFESFANSDLSDLQTENKTLVGAINEILIIASSLGTENIKAIIEKETSALRKEIENLKETQKQLVYMAEIKGLTLGVVDGQWYDMLFDTTNMAYTDNIRVIDNNIIVINPLESAEIKYKEVIIGFLASKLTYSHELDIQYKEVIAMNSEENIMIVKDYSYDFNTEAEEVIHNVE